MRRLNVLGLVGGTAADFARANGYPAERVTGWVEYIRDERPPGRRPARLLPQPVEALLQGLNETRVLSTIRG